MNPFYRQSALRVGNGFRRLCCLLLWCAAATISQAGVYLSSYTFSSANKPYVYTNESLPSPYKLRVKIVGVPGYPDGFHAVQAYNYNYQTLESVPNPGTYTVELYWVKYASDWVTAIAVGPKLITSVTVQAAAVNNIAWNAINLPSTGLPGQTVYFSATVTNNGSTYWNSNYYLELKDWNQTHLYYPSINGVSPSGGTTVTFVLTLPSTAGVYTYGFTGMQNGVQYFGGTQYRSITVNRNPVTNSFSATPSSVSGGQAVNLISSVSDADGNLTSSAIDYIAPGGGAWVSGTAGAGTRWDGGATGTYTLPKAMPLSTVGTWQFRARGGDALGGLSDFIYQNVTVTAPTPITVSVSLDNASLSAGQTTTARSTATPSGQLAFHGLEGRPVGGAWQNWATWNDTGGTKQTVAVGPPSAGTYEVRAYAARADGVATTSATVTLNINGPPTITTHPASQTANTGGAVTFSVVAGGTPPLNYQWKKNGVNIGTNSPSHTIPSVQPSDAATGSGQGYSVVVSNGFGSVTSNLATLSVTTTQPIRLALQYWQQGDGPDRSTWYISGYNPVYEEEVAEYDNPDDPNEQTGSHTNYFDPPRMDPIWTYGYFPDGQYGSRWDTTAGSFGGPAGQNTPLTSAAGAYSPAQANRGYLLNGYNYWVGTYLVSRAWVYAPSGNSGTYQAAIYSPSGGVITYAAIYSGSYLQLNLPDWGYGAGAYRIDISYSGASSTSLPNGTVSYSLPLGISAPTAPVITVQPGPANQSVATGANVSYSVTAAGATAYQWWRGFFQIAGATTATLSLNNVQASAAGTYYVAVSGSGGTVTSNSVTLAVAPALPTITGGLAASASTGVPFNYLITASGSPTSFATTGLPPGLALSTTTIANDTITGTPTQPGTYSVGLTASNAGGAGPTATLTITVATGMPPSIALQPGNSILPAGQNASFSVVATGSAPLSYQWRRNGANLSNGGTVAGATSPTLTVSGITAADGANYSVLVTNPLGSKTSRNAILIVGSNPNIDSNSNGYSDAGETNLGARANLAGTSTVGGTLPSGWPSAGDATNTAAVGATRGEFAVDKNGAATYSIPIWVSPGTAEMEPKLSLNYSSQAGAGIAGHGWSLGGVSAIARGPQTGAVDGASHVHGVNFTTTDQFYLDGQRLILVSGTHGSAGAVYRTEIDSFTRVELKDAMSSSTAWFEAKTKAGLTMAYGNTADSAYNLSGRTDITTWSVNKITDTKGNYLTFTYLENENAANFDQRLSRADYTGNATSSPALATYASVVLEYEDRPVAERRSGYSLGYPVSSGKRLKTIKSNYGATVAREYTLTYEANPPPNRSRLKSVKETGMLDAASGTRKSYPELTFDYSAAAAGWSAELGAAWQTPYPLAKDGAKPRGTGFIDLDGDGRPDFVYFHRYGATENRGVSFNRVTGWAAEPANSAWQLSFPLAVDERTDAGTRFIDYDGDGRVDFFHAYRNSDGTLASDAFRNTGTGWESTPTWALPVEIAAHGKGDFGRRFIDVNGDGKVDLVYYHSAAGGNSVGAYLNNSGGSGSAWVSAPGYAPLMPTASEGKADNGNRFLDLNGDGLPDQLTHYNGNSLYVRRCALNTGSGWAEQGATANQQSTSPYAPAELPVIGTDSPNPLGVEVVDLNGDGLPDILQRVGNDPATTKVFFNKGTGWIQAPNEFSAPYQLANAGDKTGAAFLDVNGDGVVDLAWNRDGPNGQTDKIAGVRLGTATGWQATDASTYALPYPLAQNSGTNGTGVDLVDVDGDGFSDVIRHQQNSSGGTVAAVAKRSLATRGDLLTKVTNGLGVAATITYAPLTERSAAGATTVYDKGTTAAADVVNVVGPLLVVKTVTHDDGVGGQYPMNYFYAGLRSHRLRGSLGFESMRVTDGRTSIVATTTFKQEFPFTGMPYTSTTRSGTTNLSESITEYGSKNPAHAKVHLVMATSTIAKTRELGMADTEWVTFTNTYVPSLATNVDNYGNVKKLVVDSGGGYTKTTFSSYENDATSWFLGRLTMSSVVSVAPPLELNGPNQTTTRNSGYLYDATSGLLTDEAVEPVTDGDVSSANYGKLYASATNISGYGVDSLRTTYTYDAFGNKQTATTRGLQVTVDANGYRTPGALETRTRTTTYDAAGRFPFTTTNALGHTETCVSYDQALGLLKQLQGPNNLSTTWTYDGFGQKTREDRADTTWSTITTKWAAAATGYIPSGAKYQVETQSSGAAPSLAFFDYFGRVRRTLAVNGNGQVVLQDTDYDDRGRAYRKSNPYRTTDPAPTVYWTTTANYDVLNRPLLVRTPDDAIGVGYVETSYIYAGLVTTVTDPKLRVSEVTKNSQGWTVKSIRNKSAGVNANDYAEVTYVHDALGQVLETKAAGVTTKLFYDGRGRKEKMEDPGMGTWHYRYNAFGELVWQKDAKSQIVAMTYDQLGRMVTRTENEGTTTWTHDKRYDPVGDVLATWYGMVGKVTSPGGYEELRSCDAYGRPSGVKRKIDAVTYSVGQTYDTLGRPEKTIYPTNFQTKNVYNAYGFVKEVRRADSGANEVYWMADDYASDGRIEGEYFGNGLANQRYYSRATGRLIYASIDTGSITVAPYAIQQLAYTYDAVGNVKTRYDASTGRDERFATVGSATNSDGYDGLDRLLVHRVVAGAPATTTTVSYNQQGNITAKSDVGSYAYAYTTGSGRALPHAVSSAGANSYAYDENGNMTGGAGRALSWTSFNQLLSATQGSYTSTFAFGAAHERVKQTSHLGTTVYIGGVFEKVTNGTAWEEKCYIMAPTGRIAVYIQRSNATMETRYFHSDGLGSITTVTDEIGRVVKRFAFDAWGKRVDPTTNATIIAATNTEAGSGTSGKFTRGYTDHEHLDDLGLIHMNGRVYDPVLGRFLSADPFVGDAGDSQDYNRYSYVGNNPMNATDPSGYFKLGDAAKIAAIVVVGIVTAGAAIYAAVALAGSSVGFGAAITAVVTGGLGPLGAVVAGAAGGFGSAFAGSLLNGGSIGDAFKSGAVGALVGGITGGLTYGIGSMSGDLGYLGTAAAHGAVQGATNQATGGQFRHGFYSGFFSSAAAGPISRNVWGTTAQTVAAAVVGGTAAALGGGKFANGAASGAFTYLFNWASHVNNVHHKANMDALGRQLTRAEIETLRVVSVEADADQAVENQYRHAMRDLDHNETVDQARARANDYFRERFNNAMDRLKAGDRPGAIREFGFALHTLQDSTSPAHAGFQGWRQEMTDAGYKSGLARAHWSAELMYPGSNSALFRATRGAYEWFQAGKIPSGDLFFIYGHD